MTKEILCPCCGRRVVLFMTDGAQAYIANYFKITPDGLVGHLACPDCGTWVDVFTGDRSPPAQEVE